MALKLALEINALYKRYNGDVQALNGISLGVQEGDFFGLLGPNGAGKTTTIGIITSLVTKTAGTVKVYGINIDEDFPAAKRLIGVVPQEYNFSIFEKVEDIVCQQAGYYGISRQQAKKSAAKYLHKLGLWDKRRVPAQQLSGGMKRRLMIARGLVHEPELLILDEPTAGVDVELRRGMWEFLTELNASGRTIILTTHYLEEAEQLCNRIGIISGGKLIENTTKKSLIRMLDKETFILNTKEPISQLKQQEPFIFTIVDESTLEITLSKEEPLNRVFQYLDSQNILIESMRNKTNRLEELYMELIEK